LSKPEGSCPMGLTDQWRTIGNLKNLNPNLLFSGYYWHCAAHQLLRGPFCDGGSGGC
jgi:hypothetical protein